MISLKSDEKVLVLSILRKNLPNISVRVFGSRAKGTSKRFADLDIAVMTDSPLDLRTIGALKVDFTESNLPFKVDVIDWAATEQRFRQLIEKDLAPIE
jgi:type I restriction enzyme S subunit